MKLRKSMAISILTLIAITGCFSPGSQNVKLNWAENRISVLSDSFVIDSIFIERFGELYYAKGLLNKGRGENDVFLYGAKDDYIEYVNKLSSLNCNEDNLNLGVILRKKGSLIKVTRTIAQGLEHPQEIQTLIRLKYEPCAKKIEIKSADKIWK